MNSFMSDSRLSGRETVAARGLVNLRLRPEGPETDDGEGDLDDGEGDLGAGRGVELARSRLPPPKSTRILNG